MSSNGDPTGAGERPDPFDSDVPIYSYARGPNAAAQREIEARKEQAARDEDARLRAIIREEIAAALTFDPSDLQRALATVNRDLAGVSLEGCLRPAEQASAHVPNQTCSAE